MPSFSNWRDDLREVVDSDTPEQNVKEIKDKKGIKNKVIINPTIPESLQEIGGELIDIREIDESTAAIALIPQELAIQKKKSQLDIRLAKKRQQSMNRIKKDAVDIEKQDDLHQKQDKADAKLAQEETLTEVKVSRISPSDSKEDKKKKIQQMLDRQREWEKKQGKVPAGHATEEVVHEGKCDDCTCEGCGPDGVGHQNPCVECGGHHKEEKVSEAKVDTGKSADEKATARNQRNNPQKGDKGFGKFATSVFITRKLGEPLATGKDSAASRKRREAHAAKRGVKKEGYQHNPEKGEEEERKAENARKESGRMPPRGDKRREDFEKWYAANVKEEVISEKDLSAKERRALPNKDFALPGKGEGPQGKQAGSYPIPDEKHARSALSLVSQHGTPEEKAKVRAKVKKKFPGIQVNEADDKAFKNVVGMLQKKYGKDSVITKDSPKPKAQSKAKPKPQKPLSDKEKAQREVDARYGRTPWNKKGSLGT